MAARLRPLPDSWQYGAGYRGFRFVEWRLVYATRGDPDRAFEEYAAGCRFCLQFWGWTPDLDYAKRMACAMGLKGCPRCAKRLSKKKFRALEAHRESDKLKVCSAMLSDNTRNGFGCDHCKKRIGRSIYKKLQKIMLRKLAR